MDLMMKTKTELYTLIVRTREADCPFCGQTNYPDSLCNHCIDFHSDGHDPNAREHYFTFIEKTEGKGI